MTQRSGRTAESGAKIEDCGRSKGADGCAVAVERVLRGGWRCSGKLGRRGGTRGQACDRQRGGGTDERGDRGERRRRLGRRGSRQHLAEGTLVRVDGSACLRRSRLDVGAQRLLAVALEPKVGEQRHRGQCELQHGPEERERSPRHGATHARNVDGIPWWSNGGPVCALTAGDPGRPAERDPIPPPAPCRGVLGWPIR